MTGLFFILAFGLLAMIAVVTWWTMFRLRRPPRRTYASAVARGVPGEPAELTTPREYESWSAACRVGGSTIELPVWDIVGDDPDGPVVICTPGWGDSRVGALTRVEALAPVASRIIAWDPPGLGEAPGLCALGANEHEAIPSLMDQLSADVQARGVILAGWSLGAVVSIAAAGAFADDDRLRAVIAEAPYRLPWIPAKNVILNAGMPWAINGPIAFAMLGLRLGVGAKWAGFDRVDHAARVRTPMLILHGSDDEVCPIDDGRAIARAASRCMFIVIEGAHHNDLWTDDRFRPQCERAVQDFVHSIMSTRASTTA